MFELTDNPDQTTRVRFALDLRPAGLMKLMKLMTPMITRQMRHEVSRLDNLKPILERTP